jgi:cytidylate kinase
MPKETPTPEIDEFVRRQVAKWQRRSLAKPRPSKVRLTHEIVTISMAPGSGGSRIGALVAERLGFDFFHNDIIKSIAQDAHMGVKVVDSVEKERLSGLQDFISLLVNRHYLHPGSYQKHLVKIIGSIAQHGRAVIVGRGGNFILPAEQRFSVRVIASLDTRIRNVARHFNTSVAEAEKRVVRRESRRHAFVRQTFHTKIDDPAHYDMVLNTENISLEAGVEAIVAAVTV